MGVLCSHMIGHVAAARKRSRQRCISLRVYSINMIANKGFSDIILWEDGITLEPIRSYKFENTVFRILQWIFVKNATSSVELHQLFSWCMATLLSVCFITITVSWIGSQIPYPPLPPPSPPNPSHALGSSFQINSARDGRWGFCALTWLVM